MYGEPYNDYSIVGFTFFELAFLRVPQQTHLQPETIGEFKPNAPSEIKHTGHFQDDCAEVL